MAIIHKTRTQLVAEAIREKILSGDIKAGEPLRQAALAQELNVSRIPVREALLQLEAEGLVSFEAHKGATATEVSAKQVDEIFALRALLEAELLRYSAPHLTSEDFKQAEQLLGLIDQALAEGDIMAASGDLNTQFHDILYSKADRPQTAEIVSTLETSASRYIRMHILLAGGINTAGNEHRELMNLCEQQKITEACDFLQKHILDAREGIKTLLLKMEADKQQ